MWLNLGLVSGRGDADLSAKGSKTRDMVAGKMTPGQVAEAERRAREWKPKTASR
jgi:hypothetical protein